MKIITSSATGSRYICPDFAREDSDYDYVILVDSVAKYKAVIKGLALCEKEYEDISNDFYSIKQTLGEKVYNYIITDKPEFFEKFCKATELAKTLQLTKKEHRVALFQAVLYDNYPT